jgi:hypothetical protein
MVSRFIAAFLLIGTINLGGCASLDDVVGGIADTPDWFQKRRVEIRGEGYPDLNAVPVAAPIKGSQDRLALSASEATDARATLFGHPRSEGANLTLADMRAIAAQLRPQVPTIEPKPEGFFTQAELADLRAQVSSR